MMEEGRRDHNAYKAFMGIFRDMVEHYLSAVVTSASSFLLSEDAKAGLEDAFWDAVFLIAGDTLEAMCTKIIAVNYPVVAYDRKLSTKQQRKDAALVLQAQLESKEAALPEELYHVIRSRLQILADALSEMLENIVRHKNDIADALFHGQMFTCIENIEAAAGDYHNYARAAVVIETDCGKMIYKPRNCLADIRTRMFVQKYFPDSVIVPKCYTDGVSFGICEYLPADPVNGDTGAKKWYYALGELTAAVLLLGSSDMHFENIIASKGLPAIIDLETILLPHMDLYAKPEPDREKKPEFQDAVQSSVWGSGLLPKMMKGNQVSVLLRTGEGSSAPVVDGKEVTVLDYSDEYFTGFQAAYKRCLEKKDELEKDVKELFSEVTIRLMIRNTQTYSDLMQRLYKANVLLSERTHTSFSRQLENAMMYGWDMDRFKRICQSEASAILRGDIPWFYTFGNSHNIYDADGQVGDNIGESGIGVSLHRISQMSEPELLFEKKLIEEAFAAEPQKIRGYNKNTLKAEGKGIPERASEVLSREQAALEAGQIMQEIYGRMIQAPNGTCGWIGSNGQEGSSEVMEAGMSSGTTGIGVFAAALAAAARSGASFGEGSGEIQEKAMKCEQTAIYDLERSIESLQEIKLTDAEQILSDKLGEASGMAGLLACLCLMNRYSGCDRYRELMEQGLDILEQIDASLVTSTDRLQGLAGIISVLCRFPEYYRTTKGKALIAVFGDRLLELKQFEADGYKLWKTVSERHMISGAGHGMAGIAGALYEAGRLQSNKDYLYAALDALEYEEQTYSDKMGTWPDNRSWPAQTFMHGYCSGAPGIGIVIHQIQSLLCSEVSRDPDNIRILEVCDRCAALARKAVDHGSLLYRDHLCCGNSAAVEYYLSLGNMKEAGRALNTMFLRKEKTGTYKTVPPEYKQISRLSLFYGIAGIGYEMLRYAFPEMVIPVL